MDIFLIGQTNCENLDSWFCNLDVGYGEQDSTWDKSIHTPSPWLTLLLVLRKSHVKQKIVLTKLVNITWTYSHLFNKRGAWNKRGGGAKVAKSLNVELGINEEGGIFGKN